MTGAMAEVRFLATALTIAVALPGACASYQDFDAVLNRCIGKHTSELSYPPVNRPKAIRADNKNTVTEYEFSGAGRCRWQFISDDAGVIQSWVYPDSKAEKACHELARTQP